MSETVIKLDLNNQTIFNPIVKIRMGDGNILNINVSIFDNGETADLSKFNKAEFRGTNSNSELVIKELSDFQKNEFEFTFPKTASSVAGAFKRAYFVFYTSDGQISTSDFNIQVFQNSDSNSKHADELVDKYNEYLKKLQDIFDSGKAGLDTEIKELKDKLEEISNKLKDVNFVTQDDLKTYAKSSDLDNYVETIDFENHKNESDKKYLNQNVGTIDSTTDWNTITKSGIYHVNGSNGANAPLGSTKTWGDLLVIANGNWIEQHYFCATQRGTEYIRSYSGENSVWSPWNSPIMANDFIKKIDLKPINGATQSCHLTIVGEKSITLTFDTKIPKSAAVTCYKIDSKYAPKVNTPFTLGHNSMSSQAVLVITVKGDIVITNDDDQKAVFGSFSYSI
ncbi:BppU family phage baseplate upper protein [Companilactobacillus sp. DQM5]|uniref:BppU family phage baseplate upper protein n=1 Tax=Companilactobacillus sp. DQM5 TaxID=3463359 RepID=UPI0040589829